MVPVTVINIGELDGVLESGESPSPAPRTPFEDTPSEYAFPQSKLQAFEAWHAWQPLFYTVDWQMHSHGVIPEWSWQASQWHLGSACPAPAPTDRPPTLPRDETVASGTADSREEGLQLEAKEADVAAAPIEGPPAPLTLLREGQAIRVCWHVDAGRVLRLSDKLKISPPFTVGLAGEQAQFKILLLPKTVVVNSKSRQGFSKSQGHVALQLKCESTLHAEEAWAAFHFVVGEDRRGPVYHNFSDQPMAALQREQQLWKLSDAADLDGHVTICVELVPKHGSG